MIPLLHCCHDQKIRCLTLLLWSYYHSFSTAMIVLIRRNRLSCQHYRYTKIRWLMIKDQIEIYWLQFQLLRIVKITFVSKAVYRSIISFVSGIWGCTLFIVHCPNSYGDSDDKDDNDFPPQQSVVLMMVIAWDYIHSTHWDRPQGCSFLPPCCPLSDSPLSEACSWNKLNQDQKSSCWKNVKV